MIPQDSLKHNKGSGEGGIASSEERYSLIGDMECFAYIYDRMQEARVCSPDSKYRRVEIRGCMQDGCGQYRTRTYDLSRVKRTL